MQKQDLTPGQFAVLQALKSPMTPTQVAGVTGLPVQNVRMILLRMLHRGYIRKEFRGVYAPL